MGESTNNEIDFKKVEIIGINMTPFDVHRNCSPVDGKIIFNKHINGSYLSLKNKNALKMNERNSVLLDTEKGMIGVVQTASRMVRRIVTYKQEGDFLKQGEWFGMIKFGSQVDVIMPADCILHVNIKQQVYARKTVLAEW